MPKVAKSPKRYCTYCGKDRSIRLFKDDNEICNACLVFDRSAQITAPPVPVSQLDTLQELQVQ